MNAPQAAPQKCQDLRWPWFLLGRSDCNDNDFNKVSGGIPWRLLQ
jgi:hypothetical protein